VNVRAVCVHDVKDRDAVIRARHQPAVSRRGEDDPAVREPRRPHIMMPSAGSFVRIPFRVEIRELLQTASVEIYAVNDRVPVRRPFVAEQDRFAVIGERGIRVDAVSQCRRGRRVDHGPDAVFFRRVGRILKNVDPARAWFLHAAAPLVKRVVNVQSLVIVPG